MRHSFTGKRTIARGLAIATAAALTLGIAACSDGESTEETTTDTATTTDTTTTTTDSPAATTGASTGAQDGPAAWLATEADTAEHARGLATGHAVEASARKHNAALAATPWGVRVYAERLAALEGASVDQCARYVVAWCKHGPKAAATAQRRAA